MPGLAHRSPKNSSDKKLVAALLRWYQRHHRDLPWRKTKDPYPIWVSEIMLQQTRVAAALPYYERFLREFPDVYSLANAPQAKLLEVWSGLGYYRRARQMQKAARAIVEQHGGAFPDTYEELLTLPGIGPYTAAAIASISFGRPHAVVDGNVIRVMSRLANEDRDVKRAEVKEAIRIQAQGLGEAGAPRRFGQFNQAVMELGATLCLPRNPRCLLCPVREGCAAFKKGVQESRPVKSRNDKTIELEMAVAVVRRGSSYLMRQRPATSTIMPGFWELPEAAAETLDQNCFQDLRIQLIEHLGDFRHSITFRTYRGRVYQAKLTGRAPSGYRWISNESLKSVPVTTVTRKAMKVALQA